MVINLSQVQPFLVVLLPLIMPYIGDIGASVLSQDGFPQFANDAIAWALLILTSVASGIASGQIIGTSSYTALVSVLVGIATGLLAGPLTSLQKWVNLTALIQSKVFNIVPFLDSLNNQNYLASQRVTPVQALQPPAQPPVQQPARPVRQPQPIQLPQPARQIPAVNLNAPVQQVPFPTQLPVPTQLPGTAAQSQTISFGDTGITPVVPGK